MASATSVASRGKPGSDTLHQPERSDAARSRRHKAYSPGATTAVPSHPQSGLATMGSRESKGGWVLDEAHSANHWIRLTDLPCSFPPFDHQSN
eukprot:scaffold199086_cov36-Tisochrysis_lutea.AAC.2